MMMLTDGKLARQIKKGDINGIPVEWLVRSWRSELCSYLDHWVAKEADRPYFPVYGEPRPFTHTLDDED